MDEMIKNLIEDINNLSPKQVDDNIDLFIELSRLTNMHSNHVKNKCQKISAYLVSRYNLPENSVSEAIYCLIHKINPPTCHRCGTNLSFRSFKEGYKKNCPDHSCRGKDKEILRKRKETFLKNYGSFNSKVVLHEKKKETLIANYGSINNYKNELSKKLKETYSKRTAKDIEKINKKREITCIARYGPEYKEVFANKRNESLINMGVTSTSQLRVCPSTIEILANKALLEKYITKYTIGELSNILSVSMNCIYESIHRHGLCDYLDATKAGKSHPEKIILRFLSKLNIKNIYTNVRDIVPPKEIDVYLPDHNVAIEYNGIYWHSELMGKDKNYHLEKTRECEKNNIKLIHIFENEWTYKRDIVESRLSSLLNQNETIYARKTKVVELSNKESSTFLQTNHLQGPAPASVRLGLEYDDEIVAVMTFSKTRFSKKYEWEMVRYCSKTFTNVVGGAQKLFKRFLKLNKPKSVVSYADRRYSSGTVRTLYDNLGFVFSHNSSPNYWYFKDTINLYSRVMFQKHKLKNVLDEYDASLTEWENMVMNGYNRIWDCGNMVYVYDRDE